MAKSIKTLEEVFTAKYPQYAKNLIGTFEEANGVPAEWRNVTRVTLHEFVQLLTNKVALNTARFYCAMFKAVLNLYKDEVDLPDDYQKILQIRGEASVSTWLTEEDIDKLLAYQPKNSTELLVRDQFVLGCLTGARYSDYTRLSEGCIEEVHLMDAEGNDKSFKKIVYVSQKTHIKSEVPLSPAAERIISCGSAIGRTTIVTFNSTIRDVCRKSGITDRVRIYHGEKDLEGEKWEFVSSHTARKSFATNVYLRSRDIFLVSKYMGHTSVEMTAAYILSIGDAPQAVRDFFEKFT